MFDELIKTLQEKIQETLNTQKDLNDAKQNLENEYKEKTNQILKTAGVLEGRLAAFSFMIEYCKNASNETSKDKESDK